jgi:FMN phosphatase YigB (HAD superfamily)
MPQTIHLVFDLGGTLVFDPFDETIARLLRPPLRQKLHAGLIPEVVDDFVDRWKRENTEFNFRFASHFLQEEVWIARAAWAAYDAGKVVSTKLYPIWSTELLSTYRAVALDVIANQPHLPDLRHALSVAKKRGYVLMVASNDRFFSTIAMLDVAGIRRYFNRVLTSEQLSFTNAGAEKPSPLFFDTLHKEIGLQFEVSRIFYLGDDETRDICSIQDLPMRSVRFFGNPSSSKSWLDNSQNTQAKLSYSNYAELAALINDNAFEGLRTDARG